MKRSVDRIRKIFLGCIGAALTVAPAAQAADKAITVGGKNFTEQYLLAEMAGALLRRGGLEVNLKTGVGSVIARKSLANNQIDLYYEYTGTAYTVYYDQEDPDVMRDPEKVYEWVKERDAEKDLVWLERVDFNNTYTLMMRKAHAEELGIASISDVAAFVRKNPEKLTLAVGAEFWERPDGFKAMMKAYNFKLGLRQIKKMSIGLTYRALRDGQVDVAMGFATDGRINAYDFTTLKDDRGFFPVYNPAPVVRREVLEKHPEITDLLAPLAEKLTTDQMRKLNATVDVQHKDEHEAAVQWLQEQGLIE